MNLVMSHSKEAQDVTRRAMQNNECFAHYENFQYRRQQEAFILYKAMEQILAARKCVSSHSRVFHIPKPNWETQSYDWIRIAVSLSHETSRQKTLDISGATRSSAPPAVIPEFPRPEC